MSLSFLSLIFFSPNSYKYLLRQRTELLSLKMFNLIIVSCLILPACQGLEGGRTDVRTSLGDPQSDAYIDQILENLRQMIMEQGLDPMALPDLETGFSDTILGITWHGSATVIPPSRLCSHWSSAYITALLLVESFVVMKYFHSDASPALLSYEEPAKGKKCP